MNSIKPIRTTLQIGASVFGISAIFLLIFPALFLELLNLEGTNSLQWAMRMIAITLVALTGNMYLVAKHASHDGVILSAKVMLLAAAGLGIITLLIPTTLNVFILGYALIGFGFSGTYATLLWRTNRSR